MKGALFARYSRSDKSLRRLFLDEFVGDLDITGDLTVDASIGLKRAEQLYDRVFLEYGDDSVAQLGGVHLACEQASNLLTKVLEWGRLMAYLEQSTRYIEYDSRLGGRYRYYRPPEVLRVASSARATSNRSTSCSTIYSRLAARSCSDWARERYPKDPGDSDFVYKQTIKAKACDALRGILPAATLSNVGIYGTGQGYEALLLRMRAHPLPEARHYAELMLDRAAQGRAVVPHPGRPARARAARGASTSPRPGTTPTTSSHRIFGRLEPEPRHRRHARRLRPRGRRQGAGGDLLPAHATCPRTRSSTGCARCRPTNASSILRAYVGERTNRRHKPGRAFERTDYRFDVLADYGAFRDLQRHRMLTIEWQQLSPAHGYEIPGARQRSRRGRDAFVQAMDISAALLRRDGVPVPGAGVVRGLARVPDAVRDADERARGDAPHRAAHHTAGPPVVPASSPRRCTA